MHLFGTSARFSVPAAGLFSRSRLRGTKGPECTLGASLGPGRAPRRGLRGACSERSKSRDLASNRGIAFRRARANQPYGNPQNKKKKKSVYISLPLFLKYHSSRHRIGSHGTTAVLQAFPFVSQELWFGLCVREHACVCVCMCAIAVYDPTAEERGTRNSLKNRGAI